MTTIPQNTPPRDPLERSDWIIRALAERGSSLARVAANLGVSRQLLRQTMTYPASIRADEAIAAALDMAPAMLWTERYTEDGQRIDRRKKNSGFAIRRQPTRTPENHQRKAT